MQTRKVVINTCFGGFNLSDKAIQVYADKKGVDAADIYVTDAVVLIGFALLLGLMFHDQSTHCTERGGNPTTHFYGKTVSIQCDK